MTREACIIAGGMFGESYALLKNRDRNYTPNISLVHEVLNSVEVVYLLDEKTGWVEGMNEFGIGLVNSALMVSRDESERDEVERTKKKLQDGEIILKALQQKTVTQAAKVARTYKGGLKGHTLVSDGKKTLFVEMPDSDSIDYNDVPVEKLFVRTNHGIQFPDAGYVSGPREESSKKRHNQAEEILSKVESPEDIGPALLRARKDRWEPTEMVRDNKSDRKMRTTSQMVLNLTEKKFLLYLFPEIVDYQGLEDRLPKGYKPKVTIQVLEYKDLAVGTKAETKKVASELLPIMNPLYNIREVYKQLILLEDHLFQPRKQCRDCIWKHLMTAEALAEEAITLDVDHTLDPAHYDLAERIRGLQRQVQNGIPFGEIAQGAREIRKGLLGVASAVRVASQYINALGEDKGCDRYTHSYCWVDPEGQLHLVGAEGHKNWAQKYVFQHPELEDETLDAYSYYEALLLRAGWIRVANIYNMEFYTIHSASPKAIETIISTMLRCTTLNVFDRLDPDANVTISYAGRKNRTQQTVTEFIEQFGSHADVEKMFESLNNLKTAQRVASQYINARKEILNEQLVARFRKDILQIAKAAETVDNLQDIDIIKKAVRKWHEQFENFGAGIREDLEGRIREAEMYKKHPGLEPLRPVSDPGWAKWYLDNMKPFWDLAYEVRSVPREHELKGSDRGPWEDPEAIKQRLLDFYKEQYPEKDADYEVDKYLTYRPPMTRQEAAAASLKEWVEEVRTWGQRVRAKARAAWKYLTDLISWTERETYNGGGGKESIGVISPETEILTLEGFKVVFVGAEDEPQRLQKDLPKLKHALNKYRERASRVLPLLLQKQLPIEVNWTFEHGGGGEAGRYEYDRIVVTPWGLGDVDYLVQVLAHEMGHHLYKGLSSKASSFWDTAVSGDYGPLDLREAVKTLDRLGFKDLRDEKVLADKDPILFLQLETLHNDIRYKHLDLLGLRSYKEYLEGGGDPMFQVPQSPITGYAGKNREEAFCEAIGRLVAFGPSVLPEQVKGWLRVILPTIKVASTCPSENADSYAWVSPQGKVFELQNWETHGESALRLLPSGHPYIKKMNDKLEAFVFNKETSRHQTEKSEREELRISYGRGASEVLLSQGWIQCSNPYAMGGTPIAYERTWAVALGLTVKCAVQSGYDIFSKRMYIGDPNSSAYEYITIDQAVAKYAPHFVDKLYNIKVASGCYHGGISYAWVSPDGKMYPLKGKSHAEYALEQLSTAHPLYKEMEEAIQSYLPSEENKFLSIADGVQNIRDDYALLAQEDLIERGWVQMGSAYFMTFSEKATSKALAKAFKVTIDCVNLSKEDPFEEFVSLYVGKGSLYPTRMTVADAVHGYAPQLEALLYERVLDKRAADCGRSGHSYAWVSPEGKVHFLKGTTHAGYAWDTILGDKNPLKHQLEEALEKAESSTGFRYRSPLEEEEDLRDEYKYRALDLLLAKGWVKVTDPYTFDFYPNATDKALESAFQLTLDCLRQKREDPFEARVDVYMPAHTEYTLIDALAKFTPQLEEDLYVNKVASGCYRGGTSSAWVSSDGELYPVRHNTHADYALRLLSPSDILFKAMQEEISKCDEDAVPYIKEEFAIKAEDDLIRKGWVRVGSAYSFAFSIYATEKALKVALQLTLDCLKLSNEDPFVEQVWLDVGGVSKHMTVIDALHKYAPQLEENLYKEASVKQANGCRDHGYSYAWVNPTGQVHLLHGVPHAEFAWRELGDSNPMIKQVEKAILEADYTTESKYLTPYDIMEDIRDEFKGKAIDVLLSRGWVKVGNPYMMDFRKDTPDKAVEAALQLTVDCVNKSKGDIFKQNIDVYLPKHERLTVDVAVHKYAPQLEESLFKEASSVQRVARAWRQSMHDPSRLRIYAQDPVQVFSGLATEESPFEIALFTVRDSFQEEFVLGWWDLEEQESNLGVGEPVGSIGEEALANQIAKKTALRLQGGFYVWDRKSKAVAAAKDIIKSVQQSRALK